MHPGLVCPANEVPRSLTSKIVQEAFDEYVVWHPKRRENNQRYRSLHQVHTEDLPQEIQRSDEKAAAVTGRDEAKEGS